MKKVLAMFTMITMLISIFSMNALAAAQTDVDLSDIAQPDTIETHYIFENGELKEISHEEYLELKKIVEINDSPETEFIPIMPVVDTSYTFTKTAGSIKYNPKVAVSPWVTSPGTATASTSVTTSETWNQSISVTFKEFIMTKASLGVTLGHSSTSATGSSAGASFPAKSGYTYCKVYFEPKIGHVEGKATETKEYNNSYTTTSYDIKADCPVILNNGIADGIYSPVYSNTAS